MQKQKERPLGSKTYGHIGHLPGSRMGAGDHGVTSAQAKRCLKEGKPGDHVFLTEKLDGSNVAVARIDGEICPLIRSGYRAEASKYEQHRLFAAWAWSNRHRFLDCLGEGERLCGEWLAQAHGTRYALSHDPFVAFDIIKGDERLPYRDFRNRICGSFVSARLFTCGIQPLKKAISILDSRIFYSPIHGYREVSHGAIDEPEGIVWRVENNEKFDFLAKWVRPGKVDGKYLDGPEVWNWRP